LPARISLTLSLPALAPDDGVDVPVDDLGILVLEVALVNLEVFGVQLQAVAPPVRGDGFGGVDRDASLEQDVDEEFADFAERGVVGGHRCSWDEGLVFMLEEDRSSWKVVVANASGHPGGELYVGGLRHVVEVDST
jgi:hypothetical protein